MRWVGSLPYIMGFALLLNSPGGSAAAEEHAGYHSCFLDKQAQGMSNEALSVVVEIVTMTSHGPMTGTGFIVNGSDLGSGLSARRIVTARHVVMPAGRDVTSIGILASDGQFIGTAGVVDVTRPRSRRASDGQTMRGADVAVLEMRRFFPGSRQHYDHLPGLSLTPAPRPEILMGVIDTPGGIEHGASGGPAINDDGLVEGIVIRATDTIQGKVELRRKGAAGHLSASKTGQGYDRSQIVVDMPYHNKGYVEPLSEPLILSALGSKATIAARVPSHGRIHVRIPAYPMEECVVYDGDLN